MNGPARAGERKLFENVRGWEVERNIGQTAAIYLPMSYSYRDKEDGNAENVIVLSLDEGKVNLVLGYDNWTWDKDEAVQASFSPTSRCSIPSRDGRGCQAPVVAPPGYGDPEAAEGEADRSQVR